MSFTPLPAYISFVRNKLFGPQGSFLKHIQSATKTRVQLRGKGSGYFEVKAPVEQGCVLEQMHFVVEGNDQVDVAKAKELCEDLIATVKAEYDAKISSSAYNTQYNNLQYNAQYQTQYNAYMQQAYAQYHSHYYNKNLDKKD